MVSRALLCLLVHVAIAEPADIDELPIVEMSLEPASKPLPEVTDNIAALELTRKRVEEQGFKQVEQCYKDARAKAFSLIDKTAADASSVSAASPAFLQMSAAEDVSSLLVSFGPLEPVASSITSSITHLEYKRSKQESRMLEQACRDMASLTNIVVAELQASLKRELHGLSTRQRSAAFLQLKPVAVRVSPSSGSFPRVGAMVMQMEIDRDLSEAALHDRILELESKLVEEELGMVAEALKKIFAK